MPVVQDTGPQTLDDVYVILTNPPQAIQGVNTSAVGLVGTCTRGIPGVIYNFRSYPQAVQTVGPSSLTVTGPIAIQNLIRQKCGDIYFVPVFGATAAAATLALQDATSAPVLVLTYADQNPQTGDLQPSFGTFGNGATAVVVQGTNAGTFNLTVTSPDGRQVDTFIGLTPSGAVAAINATAKVAIASFPIVSAPGVAPTDTTVATGGTIPNVKIYGKMTWTNVNGETTPGAEFTVDLTASATQTNELTFTPPTAPVTGGVTGYKIYLSATQGSETLAGASSSDTGTLLISALPTAGAASPPITNTATITPSTVPAAGNFTLSGGSQGAATVDVDYVGTTTSSGAKTGLVALESVADKLSFVMAAEQYSTAINAAVEAFGAAYDCEPIICLPPSTMVSAAINAMASYSQSGLVVAYPWQTVFDPDIQQNRVTAPTSFVSGVGSVFGPEQSLGNKPISGSLATDVQLSPTDIKNLVAANIMVVGVTIPAGSIGIRNGQDTKGNQVFVTRMQYFIASLVEAAIGPYVDQLQSTDSNDPLRRWVTSSVQMNLQSLMGNPAQGVVGRIDNYSVVSNLTNNNPQTIAEDELFVDVAVNLLSNAGKIYVRANIGQGVTITSSAA